MRPLIDSLTDYLSLKLGQHNVKLGKQFIKFCLVGVTNLAIYLAVYWLATRLLSWHYLFGSIAGFIVAVTWSFFVNLRWTFRAGGGDKKRQYLTFIAANLISMGVNLSLLTLFVEVFGIYDLYAQFTSSFIVAFINFSLNRFWTFKSH